MKKLETFGIKVKLRGIIKPILNIKNTDLKSIEQRYSVRLQRTKFLKVLWDLVYGPSLGGIFSTAKRREWMRQSSSPSSNSPWFCCYKKSDFRPTSFPFANKFVKKWKELPQENSKLTNLEDIQEEYKIIFQEYCTRDTYSTGEELYSVLRNIVLENSDLSLKPGSVDS